MPTTHTHQHAPATDVLTRALPVPRKITVAAWSVPVMILGEFAFLAVVPVAVIVVSVFRNARLRALRPCAAALGILYGTPLGIWALNPDRAPSLSKDINPWLATLVIAGAITLGVKAHILNRPARQAPTAH